MPTRKRLLSCSLNEARRGCNWLGWWLEMEHGEAATGGLGRALVGWVSVNCWLVDCLAECDCLPCGPFRAPTRPLRPCLQCWGPAPTASSAPPTSRPTV